MSNQDKWYLDHIDTPWQMFYANEPFEMIKDEKRQSLVLGGEVCMWGEHIDASDIQQTIWPRAAAAAGTYINLFLYILQNILFLHFVCYFFAKNINVLYSGV